MSRFSRKIRNEIDLPKAKLDRESLREALGLFQYLRPYRVRFAFALAALFASSALSLAFPYMAGSIVDAAAARNTGCRPASSSHASASSSFPPSPRTKPRWNCASARAAASAFSSSA